jgi:endonuclease G
MNYGVPARELAKDPRVLDAGVRFSGEPQASGDPWAAWWERPRADRDDADGAAAASPTRVVQATTAQAGAHAMADGSISISVPLHVTIRLGSPAPTAAADQVEVGIGTEGLVIPWHDEDYGSRRGYRPDFIGAGVPMPRPADPSVVALAKDGSSLLHYENFSVAMHARRCMALFTASNVTAEPRFKKPEPGRSYSRKALSGLGPNDQERWFPDPRMDNAFQLPDVFYTRDDGAFDKGHIVRREDVAWGETFEALRRANGDTYHVTNCSPQVAGFNRSTEGEDNWGDLENHVLKGAASERYCQFAGPILDPADEVFVGAGGGRVRLRVKIPSRYWKVIVVRTASGIASYGFVLEQDLSQVPTEEEFVVPANFRRFMEPLAELERKAGIVFPDEVRLADQHDTDEGVELAMRAGLRRRAAGAEAPTETMVL